MHPLEQLCQKLNAERTYQSTRERQPPPETAPPPYTQSDTDSDSDDDEDEASSPMRLTINAAHSIQGHNNLVPTSPTPLADATKFSALLLAAVKQLNSVAGVASETTRRSLKVDLTINCGIMVIGDRNVVGNVGLKPKSPAQAVAGPGAMLGAKRKAGSVCACQSTRGNQGER